jgi:hypothetical protein
VDSAPQPNPRSEFSSLALGPRLRIRLHEWKAEGRISWADFSDVMADAISDMAAAVDQALEDQAEFSVDAAQARHVEIAYQLLQSAPYSRSTYYEPRNFATFERTPAPDVRRPGDVVDVDPADVPDLPALADVTLAPQISSTWSRPSAA